MIRVLHCVAGVGRGGYEGIIMNVYRNIDRTKVQFDFLYSFDGVYEKEIQSLGGKLYKIPFITQVGPFAYKKAVLKFLKAHPEYKIVHSHMDKFSGFIMACAKKTGVPVRISHSHSTKNEGGVLFHLVKNYYGKMIDANCTHRFACGEKAYSWLFGNNIDNKQIIRNGIDVKKFLPIDNRDEQFFTIANVARFNKAKNHEFLIEIFNEVYIKDNTARLLLAGTGDLQKKIKEKVKRLNLETVVTFMNDCNDVPALLTKADVFCLPSYFEGWGIVLIEAQAAGVPCVASENVPKQVDLTDTVKFIPLNEPPTVWADEILKFKGKERQNYHEIITEKGYNIETTSSQLQDFYTENG